MANKINCSKIYTDVAHKVSLSATILDKIKGEVGIDPVKMGELNQWTDYVLRRIKMQCEIYNASARTPQDQQLFQAELDKLDGWVMDIANVLGKYGALAAASTANPVSSEEKEQAKKDVENTIDKHAKDDSKDPSSKSDDSNQKKTVAELIEELNTVASSKTDLLYV